MAQGKRTKIAAIIILVEAIILVVGGLGAYGYTYLVLGGPCAHNIDNIDCGSELVCSDLPELCLSDMTLNFAEWTLGIGLIMLITALLLFRKNKALWVGGALIYLLMLVWIAPAFIHESIGFALLASLPITIPPLILLSDIRNVFKKN